MIFTILALAPTEGDGDVLDPAIKGEAVQLLKQPRQCETCVYLGPLCAGCHCQAKRFGGKCGAPTLPLRLAALYWRDTGGVGACPAWEAR